MFSKIPLRNLVELCRVLRHSLGAGLTLCEVFRQQGRRGATAVRPVAERISIALGQGESLQVALETERRAFPPLFPAMASVGEESGQLAEIFGELEKYYALQLKLRRQVISQSTLPVIQLIFGFFVIALLIFVLGIISQSRPGTSSAPGILGLTGAAGSILFLSLSFGSIALLIAAYLVVTRMFQQKPAFDRLLLWPPVLGSCIEAFVLGRFAMALRLTLNTGMPIQRAVRLSLEATGNAAFIAYAGTISQSLKSGATLTESLSLCPLFSSDFLNMVASGEEGGRVPEIMAHQAEYYFEEASRRLTLLAKLLNQGVWLVYAIFTIAAIFIIFSRYLSALNP